VTAAWAYYRHIEEWVSGGRKVGTGMKEKGVGEKEGEQRKCSKAKVK